MGRDKHIAEADNTVRESKNQTMLKWLPYMLLQKGLQLCGICFHRVGHTHGSLGVLTSFATCLNFDLNWYYIRCQQVGWLRCWLLGVKLIMAGTVALLLLCYLLFLLVGDVIANPLELRSDLWPHQQSHSLRRLPCRSNRHCYDTGSRFWKRKAVN